MATTTNQKTECINPNTGGRMNIDTRIYDLFSKAIYHMLMKGGPLTFTELSQGVHDCFRQQKTKFNGSVNWYALTVKNNMHARGIIEVYTEKGKKLHRLVK
jgi:hypothetical protein